MSISDVIKKSVLEHFNSGNIDTTTILVVLAMALVLGLFVYFVYRFTARSGFYNRNLNKTLAAMPVITAAIMLAMQSNLVISLGMVGALSIVRFRNAVKDAIDLTFLFWSISIGIITGAGLFELAVILSLCMAVLIFAIDLLPAFRAPYLLVISSEKDVEESDLLKVVRNFDHKAQVRSRNVTIRSTEWIIELQTKKQDELIKNINDIKGIISLNLLSHDGDVRY